MKTTMLLFVLAGAASSQAGTFTLIGPDSSQVVVNGASFSATASSCTYSMVCETSAFGGGSFTATKSVMGIMKWRVRWTPDYVGEPMPEHFPVEIEVKGSAYATVSMPPYYGYYNPQTVKADASLVDFFRVTSLSRTTPGTVIYNIPNGVLGTAYSATGSLFWGNGYETTIELAINASTMSSAMTSGPLCYSKSETSTILTIKKIGNQVM